MLMIKLTDGLENRSFLMPCKKDIKKRIQKMYNIKQTVKYKTNIVLKINFKILTINIENNKKRFE